MQPSEQDTSDGRPASRRQCEVRSVFHQVGGEAVARNPAKDRAFGTSDTCHFGFAEPRNGFGQRIEHGLQIEGRAADDLEHVGGGGLLLQRFAQLVEQPGVLDGDDGLGRKIFTKSICLSVKG